MTIHRIAFVAVIGLLLNGCIFRDDSQVYLRSGSIKPMELPPGVKAARIEPLYPIPSVERQENAFYNLETDGFVIPRPEPMSAEREASKIKIQKVGDSRWVLAEASTSQIWPLSQSYLSGMGFNVVNSNPSTGLIQTDWIVFKANPDMQSRFQIRIEKGVSADSSEIHILQHDTPLNAPYTADWPSKSDDPTREAWLMEDLANSLAGNIENKAASLLGQSVGGDVKSELFMDGNEPSLRLRISRDRAWATLAQALDREGFINWGDDTDLGVFYVQFDDPEKAPGWFKRWFYPKRFLTAKTTSYSLEQVLQHLSPTDDVKKHFAVIPKAAYGEALDKNVGYLVLMQPRDGSFVVTIRRANGERPPLAENKRLLLVIHRNLI
jgi:outer membrane protein assembly factor BamC